MKTRLRQGLRVGCWRQGCRCFANNLFVVALNNKCFGFTTLETFSTRRKNVTASDDSVVLGTPVTPAQLYESTYKFPIGLVAGEGCAFIRQISVPLDLCTLGSGLQCHCIYLQVFHACKRKTEVRVHVYNYEPTVQLYVYMHECLRVPV